MNTTSRCCSGPDLLSLVVVWIVMIPLVYFASSGTLWFQSIALNWALPQQNGSLVTPSMRAENIFVTILVFSFVFVLICPRIKSVILLCKKNKVFLWLGLLALASCVWSQFPLRSLENGFCIVGNILFAFYLCLRFEAEKLLKVLLVLGWICLIPSIAMAVYFPQYGIDQSIHDVICWRGIYPHKNICALMTVFLLSVAFYLPAGGFIPRTLRVIYIGLSIFLIVMTQSTTSRLLLGVLLLYVVGMRAIRNFSFNSKVVLSGLTAIVALPLLIAASSHVGEIAYLLGKDPTLTGRTDIWKAVMSSIMKHPFLGYGYMGFWRGMSGESAYTSLLVGSVTATTHNGFLDVWLSLGVLGLSLLIYSFVRALLNAGTCIGAEKSSLFQWYLCIVILSLILSFDEVQLMIPNNLVFILYMVACIGLCKGAQEIRHG